MHSEKTDVEQVVRRRKGDEDTVISVDSPPVTMENAFVVDSEKVLEEQQVRRQMRPVICIILFWIVVCIVGMVGLLFYIETHHDLLVMTIEKVFLIVFALTFSILFSFLIVLRNTWPVNILISMFAVGIFGFMTGFATCYHFVNAFYREQNQDL